MTRQLRTQQAARSVKAPRGQGGIVSVRRSLQVIELLSERERGLTLSDIARELGVNKAIALRLVDVLDECSFVSRDEATLAYELTYKLSNLGLRKLSNAGLFDQASRVLRDLADRSGELARLAVVEQEHRITWVLAAAGKKRTLQIDPNYRLEISLHTHAAGKAWLSTLPMEDALALMRASGLEKFTRYSRTGPREIQADLAEARRLGYALSYEENELGVGAIAAPILVRLLSGEARCVATISLAAPTSRMSAAELARSAPLVIEAAAAMAEIWPIDGRPFRREPPPSNASH